MIETSVIESTEGHLLDRRLRYDQPRTGFRSGIEPVLLAASIPARSGDRVLEAGSGAGAGLLCLASRTSGLRGVGVEIDRALAELARRNLEANGFPDLAIVCADILSYGETAEFDHAFANPPYHGPEGTASPQAPRARAKHGGAGLLAAWTMAMARSLRARGTLSLILPACRVPEALAALAGADCPASLLLPCWPRAGVAAKLVLLRGVKAGRTPLAIASGLVLHEACGRFTAAADAILRGGAALPPASQD